MKKVMTVIGAFLIGSSLFISCGGNESKTLTVDEVGITGNSKDYIEVVPGNYEIKMVKGSFGEELQIPIKFKVLNSYDSKEVGESTNIGNLTLQFLDQSQTPIDYDFTPAGSSDWDKIRSLLTSKQGTIVTVLFKPNGFAKEDSNDEVIKNATGFELTRADITNANSEVEELNKTNSNSNENSSSETDAESNDCEQFCSDYEAFADEYVAFMKKYRANPTDASILSEYTTIMQKVVDMEESSKNCKGDAKVANRINKALLKISKAAM